MIRLLRELALRVLVVLLLTTLCSFIALDKPVLRNLYLAFDSFVGFVLNLTVRVEPQLAPVWNAYWRSMVLLLSGLVTGILIGVPLGLLAGAKRQSLVGRIASLVSYLGTLTPSFLFALVVMVFFVRYLGYYTGWQWIRIAPTANIPELREIIAPALTLAARPIAHIAQVTSVQVYEQLRIGYVQTARGKGLPERRVIFGHVWPNVAGQILTAAISSLAFSLSSLPIVEYVFSWNGVGYTLLVAVLSLRAIQAALLIASLGITFVVLTVIAEAISLRLDPRLRERALEGGS